MHQDAPQNKPLIIYGDSDPITYYDPIINADSGDIISAISRIKKHQTVKIPFITKGILTKRDEITLSKIIHNANLHDKTFKTNE